MSDRGVAAEDMLDRRRRLRLLGIAVSAVLIALALFLATKGGDGGDAAVDATPHFVDAAGLAELESTLGHAVYWAGERPPAQLELSEEGDGSVYLRYLPPGVEAGDPRPRFLTVGTYPVAGAVAALRRSANEADAELQRAGEAVVLPNPESRGSVYFAFPGADLQIEVYDPRPGAALRLVRSGDLGPVG